MSDLPTRRAPARMGIQSGRFPTPGRPARVREPEHLKVSTAENAAGLARYLASRGRGNTKGNTR